MRIPTKSAVDSERRRPPGWAGSRVGVGIRSVDDLGVKVLKDPRKSDQLTDWIWSRSVTTDGARDDAEDKTED